MPRKPTWEDADILLRIDDLAARPETRAALDWFRKNHLGVVGAPPVRFPHDSPEYEHVQRFIELFETLGTLVKLGVLNEELVHERWLTRAPWDFLRPTIEQDRRELGPDYAGNFEWLAERDRRWAERRKGEHKA
ncbi:MAG TPA: hypothetical protein VMI55_07970 [Thermoplasmata archaeon]|nr:hypothetical protein [Thermoplasmata archaeon]